jgi:hypothetical protein
MAVEEPKYTIIESDGNCELREYDKLIVAEIVVAGPFEDAGSLGFRPLAQYIFGANTSRQSIAMTAPVQLEKKTEKIAMTAPVTQFAQGDSQWAVSFTMPPGLTLDSLPIPKDPNVTLKEIPRRRLAVIKYSGGWSQDKFEGQLFQLRAWVDEKKNEGNRRANLCALQSTLDSVVSATK